MFRHPDDATRSPKLLRSVAQFPERAHLVGAYALGKAQRVIALLREAGYDEPIYLHGALERLTRYYRGHGIDLGDLRPVHDGTEEGRLRRRHRARPAVGLADRWTRRFPIRSRPSRPAGCGCAPARRQRGVELPLVISDHADWDELTATIEATGAGEIWVTHGREDALVHWCKTHGLERPAARSGRL